MTGNVPGRLTESGKTSCNLSVTESLRCVAERVKNTPFTWRFAARPDGRSGQCVVSSFAPAEPIPLYALLHPRKGKSQCVVSSSAPAENELSSKVSDSSKGSTLCVV